MSRAARAMSGVVTFAVFALALTTPADAQTMSEAAQAHYERGLRHHERARGTSDLDKRERYLDQAAQEFDAAYEVDPHPEILYAWARAEDDAGRCAKALDLYERFLEQPSSRRAESLARSYIALCRKKLGLPPVEETEISTAAEGDHQVRDEKPPESEPPPEPPRPTAPARPRAPERWYQDWLGHGLAAGAIGAAAFATGFYLSSRDHERAAGAGGQSYGAAREHYDLARSRRWMSGGAAAISLALAGAAIAVYSIGDEWPERGTASVLLAPGTVSFAYATPF